MASNKKIFRWDRPSIPEPPSSVAAPVPREFQSQNAGEDLAIPENPLPAPQAATRATPGFQLAWQLGEPVLTAEAASASPEAHPQRRLLDTLELEHRGYSDHFLLAMCHAKIEYLQEKLLERTKAYEELAKATRQGPPNLNAFSEEMADCIVDCELSQKEAGNYIRSMLGDFFRQPIRDPKDNRPPAIAFWENLQAISKYYPQPSSPIQLIRFSPKSPRWPGRNLVISQIDHDTGLYATLVDAQGKTMGFAAVEEISKLAPYIMKSETISEPQAVPELPEPEATSLAVPVISAPVLETAPKKQAKKQASKKKTKTRKKGL